MQALNVPKWPMKEAQLHAVLLTNRAACFVQTHTDLDKCIEDCTLAISEHPTYGKAFYRRGQAYELQGKIKEAFQGIFQHILTPNNPRHARTNQT
jgi:tetratricopeptide (TPR) repeat protein